MRERRQNVRVRPSADYDIAVEYVDGLFTVKVQVLDLAIGGMGLVVDEMFASKGVGDDLVLHLTFPGFPRFETTAELRHSTKTPGGKCGISLGRLTSEQTAVLRHAVAELQERGHSA